MGYGRRPLGLSANGKTAVKPRFRSKIDKNTSDQIIPAYILGGGATERIMSRATAAPPQSLTALERAIWQTVAYFDVFDYPLTAAEVHRYLEGVTARASDIAHTLANGRFSPQHLVHANGYYMFAGREHIVAKRQRRHALAQRLWPAAIRYGRFISSLPFVRMVAVTGSLAVNNVDEHADIDYLVVTENGRLWLCRAFIIAIVRLAARQQLTLCPNYLLSERVLQFSDRNLYTAHEVAQMIPLSGLATYQQMRQANLWTAAYIPNAIGPPTHVAPAPVAPHLGQRLLELPWRTPLGDWLEQWEMQRKIHKFQAHVQHNGETDFTADWCKGHFDAHNERTMTAYQAKLSSNQ